MFRSLTILLLGAGSALASDPAPTPADPSVITASKEVSGTGKRQDPFVFDSSTKCVLRLTGPVAGIQFDLEDAPTNTEVIDRALIFSLAEPGLFQIIAHGPNCYSKVWFEIKGSNGPPSPVNALATQLRAALAGDNARSDAARLHGMTGALADALEAGQFTNYGQMHAAWKATQAANKWPAGLYPKLPDVIRLAIPTAEETVALDASNTPAILANLRILEATAKSISEGK